ncbi:MAG TPA: carboxypeptidase regulatory-like domain-containing protein [Bryobacteraceae bacterium]|nr:carboxypeptidase regulatory-like domain-containing protein [Bryobacteraceae bacterium]
MLEVCLPFLSARRLAHVLIFTLCLPAAFAQQPVAAISGTVTDPTGAAVPDALITATNVHTMLVRETRTSEGGSYVIPNLLIGEYRVEAQHAGFRRAARGPISLQVDQRATIDFQLQIGEVTGTVDVISEAPLLQTASSSVGQVVGTRMILDLPLNGRNFYQLASLAPGVAFVPSGAPVVRSNYINVVMNGSRGHATAFLMDGVDTSEHHAGGTYVRPTVDAIEEFKAISNNFSAQYGRSPGLITTAIRSGTNQFHGTAWEYLRNSSLDARNFFAGSVAPLRYNQFGATLGGPVVRNRAFFFGSYEGTRVRQGLNFNVPVPSALNRSGDFSDARPIYDPATTRPNPTGSGFIRDQFPGNRIPATRLAPQAQALLPYYPLPNTAGGTIATAPSRATTGDQVIGRFDQQITDKDQVFVRYTINYDRIQDPNSFPSLDPIPQLAKGQNAAVRYSRIFSPTLINTVTLGYNRSRLFLDNAPNVKGSDGTTGSGILGFEETAPLYPGLPYLTMAGFGTLNDGLDQPKQNVIENKQVLNDLTHIRGSHTLKAGFEYRRLKAITRDVAYNRGSFSFTGTYTQNPAAPGGTGDAFADFLLGYPASALRSYPIETNGTFGNYFGLYFEDDWKVSRKLTLNLGLRYEYSPFFTGLRNVIAGFDPSTGKIILPEPIDLTAQPVAVRAYPFYQDVITTTQSLGLPDSITPPEKTNFAPRLGFAWQPFERTATVIRGGYGIFWNYAINDILGNNFLCPPFIIYDSATNDSPVPNRTLGNFYLGAPIPSAFGTPSISAAPVEGRNAYTNEWNLSVQQALSATLSFEAGYVGQKGTHLQRRIPVNRPQPGPGSVQARRPFPRFSDISIGGWDTDSTYHALQLRAEKRFSRGLAFTVSYAYSKSIDNNSNYFSGPLDVNNLKLERAVSDFDLPHRLVASYTYELPFRLHARAARIVLEGWQVSGITTFQSGPPFTPALSSDRLNIGTGGQRPDRIGSGNLDNPTIERWFDVSAFQTPALYVFGNAGRNILRGDGLVNWDLSAAKRFALSESLSLQFRGEFFNAFNNVNFSSPNAAVETANAGRVFGAGAARVIQFALRLSY